MGYMSFSRRVDHPDVLAELQDLVWFDYIRLACLLSLGLPTDVLTKEARRIWDKVSCEVEMHQRCLAEVTHQETALARQNELRREIVQAFSAICVDSCESIVLRP